MIRPIKFNGSIDVTRCTNNSAIEIREDGSINTTKGLKMTRARDLGIPFDGTPGRWNAITDVGSVEVGHSTIISGEGRHIVGQGPVRTGVTAILPVGKTYNPLFAGWFSFNGCGELTGTAWVEESGFLESGILITETSSVGSVRSAMLKWAFQHLLIPGKEITDVFWGLPVIGETYSGMLSDMFGFHVKEEHVYEALDSASHGPVKEGSVGGGTAMICHHFKGGIGTSSRLVDIEGNQYTLGVLVQANHGGRENLHIAGVPVGKEIPDLIPEIHQDFTEDEKSSIIIVIATDAPLLPHQLKRIARRAPLGIGLVGGTGSNGSGDLAIAFSTANQSAAKKSGISESRFLPNALLNSLFLATIQATEEAIVNAMIAAETMIGINGNTVYGIPHKRLQEILKRYQRLQGED
jgi:D-aminopeptidase